MVGSLPTRRETGSKNEGEYGDPEEEGKGQKGREEGREVLVEKSKEKEKKGK